MPRTFTRKGRKKSSTKARLRIQCQRATQAARHHHERINRRATNRRIRRNAADAQMRVLDGAGVALLEKIFAPGTPTGDMARGTLLDPTQSVLEGEIDPTPYLSAGNSADVPHVGGLAIDEIDAARLFGTDDAGNVMLPGNAWVVTVTPSRHEVRRGNIDSPELVSWHRTVRKANEKLDELNG